MSAAKVTWQLRECGRKTPTPLGPRSTGPDRSRQHAGELRVHLGAPCPFPRGNVQRGVSEDGSLRMDLGVGGERMIEI